MVKISDEVKNLAVIAHDLKAPLSAVVNLLSVVEKGYVDDPEKIRELIFRARQKTETLIKMVDDIYNYILIENKQEIKQEKLDVFTIIEEAVSIIRPYAAEREISLNYNHSCREKFVNGNFTFLLRAFNNVIMNAVKYNIKNGKVDILCTGDPGQSVNIEVKDTGIGIPEEDLLHIFDLFSRGSKARNDIESGLGLGLALVKQIINEHEGSVDIASTVGSGTTVTIKLPLHGGLE